jgi:predicted ATPase
MNHYLFIDNFRGFSNARIPITQVNFLVGENSTGKTSVLGLLKLFAGPQFLFRQEFGDEEVSFGHFSDMVSAHSADQTFFRVGLVWEERKREKAAGIPVGWLCTFREEEGLPRLSRFTFCRATEKISLQFAGNDVHYKTETFESPQSVDDLLSKLLPTWIREHCKDSSGYEKLSLTSGLPRKIPIMLAISLIGGIRESISKQRKPANEIKLVLSPPEMEFPPQITWIAPIRTKPRRTYDELTLTFSPEGGHTPYLIRRILQTRSQANKFRTFIEKVGQASGLFQDIKIKKFGSGTTAPFEVDVVLDGKALNLSTVGYGVSQSLPVLVELLARSHGAWFAIQQPEVHLHPRAQAALGDVFFEMAATEHKFFLIETHSDFTIDRFRMSYRGQRSDKPDSQILFFERRDKHNVVTPITIGKSGELPSDQPESYRHFFVKEELRLLGV